MDIEVQAPVEDAPKRKMSQSYQAKLDQLEKESAKFWLADMFVDRPCTIMIVGYVVLALITLVAFHYEFF